MTLGETIYTLRNARGMSQGDLAERLNVSRQSVSKWENNTSVPELDKLLLLSDLFHISLDELTGRSPTGPAPASEPQAPPQTTPQSTFGAQRIIGFILLAVGLLCCVLSFFFGSGGLIIGWITLLPAILLAPFFTSVRMFDVFHLSAYAHAYGLRAHITGAGNSCTIKKGTPCVPFFLLICCWRQCFHHFNRLLRRPEPVTSLFIGLL